MRFAFCIKSLLIFSSLFAQSEASKVYRLNWWIDAPILAGGIAGSTYGLSEQDKLPSLSTSEINALNMENVPWFDQGAFNINPLNQRKNLDISDVVLRVGTALPVSLALDKRGRDEWFSLLVMYLQATNMSGGIQTNTAIAFGRTRPIAYLSDATTAQRKSNRNHLSFYSGHVSNTAAPLFFMAKVLNDLHPELASKRWLLFAAATIPTSVSAYTRVRAGKHFPSDVFAGALIGGGIGFLVPHLHKLKKPNPKLSLIPYFGDEVLGMRMSLELH